MSKSNVFTRAKALRKLHPNKTWQQLVKMAAGKSTSSSTTKKAMPARKKRATGTKKRKSVSGTRTRSASTKKKTTTTTKRRSVGALINKEMPYLAAGLVLSEVAEKMVLTPLRRYIPNGVKIFADPAIVVLSYKASTHFRHPLAKGIALGIMKNASGATFETIKAFLGGGNMSMTRTNVGDIMIPLPAPNIGEIKAFLGADYIPGSLAGTTDNSEYGYSLSTMSNMAGVDDPYVPLGG